MARFPEVRTPHPAGPGVGLEAGLEAGRWAGKLIFFRIVCQVFFMPAAVVVVATHYQYLPPALATAS